jgi:hypothetical protein
MNMAVPRRRSVDVAVQAPGEQSAHIANGQTHADDLAGGARHKADRNTLDKAGCPEQGQDVLTQPIPPILGNYDGAGAGKVQRETQVFLKTSGMSQMVFFEINLHMSPTAVREDFVDHLPGPVE